MQAIDNKISEWEASTFKGDYSDAKRQSNEFVNYKTSLKRTWVADKRDIDTLLGNIQTKLKTYELKPYHPPHGLSLHVTFNWFAIAAFMYICSLSSVVFCIH